MARVNIDGKDYDLPEGQNLLHACLSENLDLPYFCWHPAMGSVGSCRLCAVIQYQDEADERGRLQMACLMTVQDGMRVGIGASEGEPSRPGAFAADFRRQVIEWLMENHPHDCPVCEEGGECHLQDMTVMAGHSMRRYAGRKRTWENQYLGPFVGHEMNRCITCYRCVRYYREYAGGKDLEAFGSRARMFFGRQQDGVLESEFAGNLVEVCPTGVFTDKPFAKSYTRKWDLQSAPSVCPNCAVGCNTFPAERYGLLKRVHNRYHGEVNGYFLCDRGRYGSHFVNHDKRIRHAGVRAVDSVFEAPGRDAALAAAAERLQGADVVGIGSPRASLEANFALRALVGAENFCSGMADDEAKTIAAALDAYRTGVRIPSLSDIEKADAVLILGEDVSNTASRVALAVRQAARGATFDMADAAGIPDWQDAGVRGHGQDAKSPVFIASVASTRIDELATATRHGDAIDLARVGFGIAHAIDPSFAPGTLDTFVTAAAQALSAAERPLVITGCEARQPALVKAAANIALALRGRGRDAMLAVTATEANSYGAALLGGGLSLTAALDRARQGAVAVVVENDPSRRVPESGIEDAIVLDALETPTAETASVVLPAATYAEQTGTFVNYETRAQRFYQVFEPADEVAPSWRWIAAIARETGREGFDWADIDSLTAACAAEFPMLADIAPGAGFRVQADTKIPRQPHRYSGRTAMRAHRSVHEPKATVDTETPLSYSMEGLNTGEQPGAVVPYVWTPGWNSNQSVFKFQQEVGGALAGGDPGVRLVQVNGDARAEGCGSVPGIVPEPVPETVPEAIHANGSFIAARVSDVFGGDELSAASAPILERTPAPYVVLNPDDAQRLGVTAGGGVAIAELDTSYEVRLDAAVAAGVAGVSRDLPGTQVLASPTVTLTADPDFVPRPGGDPNLIARG